MKRADRKFWEKFKSDIYDLAPRDDACFLDILDSVVFFDHLKDCDRFCDLVAPRIEEFRAFLAGKTYMLEKSLPFERIIRCAHFGALEFEELVLIVSDRIQIECMIRYCSVPDKELVKFADESIWDAADEHKGEMTRACNRIVKSRGMICRRYHQSSLPEPYSFVIEGIMKRCKEG